MSKADVLFREFEVPKGHRRAIEDTRNFIRYNQEAIVGTTAMIGAAVAVVIQTHLPEAISNQVESIIDSVNAISQLRR